MQGSRLGRQNHKLSKNQQIIERGCGRWDDQPEPAKCPPSYPKPKKITQPPSSERPLYMCTKLLFWGHIAINQPFLRHRMHMFAACSLSRCFSCPPVCRLGGNIPSASSVCAVLIKHSCVITTLWLQKFISAHRFCPSLQCSSALVESAQSRHLPIKPNRSPLCQS